MRLFIILAACLFSLMAQAKQTTEENTQVKRWAFDVYLDDKPIGTHTFNLVNNTMTSQANFKVKILFITAYEYHHKAVETWDNNCLKTLDAETVENDTTFKVKGEQTVKAFVVRDDNKSQDLPNCSMTFAYWNPAILAQAKLLNPHNAEYLEVEIESIGTKQLKQGQQTMKAQGYAIIGSLNKQEKLDIKVWYDQNKNWVALQSVTPEGYLINYRLQTP